MAFGIGIHVVARMETAEMTVETYLQLKKEAERWQREADRSRGALDQLLARLQTEFAVKTEADGVALLKKLKKELATAEREADEALTVFREKWNEQLETKS